MTLTLAVGRLLIIAEAGSEWVTLHTAGFTPSRHHVNDVLKALRKLREATR